MKALASMARWALRAGDAGQSIDAAPPSHGGALPSLLARCSAELHAVPGRVSPPALRPRPARALRTDPQLKAFQHALEGLAQMSPEQRDAAHRQMPQRIRRLHPGVQLRAWESWIETVPKANPRAGEPHPRQFVYDALKDLPADLRAQVAQRLMHVFRNHTDLDLLLSVVLVKAHPETPREEVEAVLDAAELAYQDAKRASAGQVNGTVPPAGPLS